MAGIWLGAVTSLAGVIIGALATYFSQLRLWKRTTRRELYGTFVGQGNVCRDLLLDVAYAIRRKFPEHECNDRWERANAQIAEVSSLAAQVSMVATLRTRSAAEALEKYLFDLKSEFHVHHTNDTMPDETSVYLNEYSSTVKEFIAAASRELGIAPKFKPMQ